MTVVDKAKYSFPYFYSSTPSTASFNKAKIGFLNSFGCNRVGIIYDYTETMFLKVSDEMMRIV